MSIAASNGRVLLQRAGGVVRVTLAHPGRLNAISVAMWRELHEAFLDLSGDASVRCVVVSGADGHFAAGADIREFPEARGDFDGVVHYHTRVIAPALQALADCPHPMVARIEGACVGGGLEIASLCDLRIAARGARFGVPINRLGFSMAPHEMRGLLALAGKAATLEILLEGRVFDADEALAKGLLTRVVEPGALDDEIARCVARILRGAPLAARLNKLTLARLQAPGAPGPADWPVLFSYADSRDHREGVRAFLAGEDPVFQGD